jgi:hypothetical protein
MRLSLGNIFSVEETRGIKHIKFWKLETILSMLVSCDGMKTRTSLPKNFFIFVA